MSLGSCAAALKTASRANPAVPLPYRPRVRATPRFASRNYRRYDWIASSGSVVANDPVNGTDPKGLYTCNDCNRAELKLAKAFVRGIQSAASQKGASADLKSIATTLGSFGEKGVDVGFGGLAAGTLGEYSNGSVMLDGKQIVQAGNTLARQTGISRDFAIFTVGSRSLVHETKHHEDRSMPYRTPKERMRVERRAYRTQDALQRAYGVPGDWQREAVDPWGYAGSVNRRAIGSCAAGRGQEELAACQNVAP